MGLPRGSCDVGQTRFSNAMDECVFSPSLIFITQPTNTTRLVNDDSECMKEIFNIIGTLILTSFDVLSEHDLLGPDSPLPNIGIIALLMIEFLYDTPGDIDSDWAHEVVRALDKAGVELKPQKEVAVSQDKIDELRAQYQEKENEEVEDGKTVYEHHAGIKFWSPGDDFEGGERLWARWDWKKEVCFPHRFTMWIMRLGGEANGDDSMRSLRRIMRAGVIMILRNGVRKIRRNIPLGRKNTIGRWRE